jgi:pyridoxine kinase
MPLALLLTSHVAASMVGGGVQRVVFNNAGVDTMLVPTVNYGRHPGWGDPGGSIVSQDVFVSMLEGVEAQGMLELTDAVVTGYFADVSQIFEAVKVIDRVRKGTRSHNGLRAYHEQPMVIVDPIMGDAPEGLYVSQAVAAAIKEHLLPLADLVTPNVFELGRLTGRKLTDLNSMIRAARSLGCPVLVSSLPCDGQIGVMFIDSEEAWIVKHDRCPKALRGTGDMLTAIFVAAMMKGAHPKAALEHATAACVSVVQQANRWNSSELPIVSAIEVLRKPLISLIAESL